MVGEEGAGVAGGSGPCGGRSSPSSRVGRVVVDVSGDRAASEAGVIA